MKFCSNCGFAVPESASKPAHKPAPKPASKSFRPTSKPLPKFKKNVTGNGTVMPSYRGASSTTIESKHVVKKAGWTPPIKEIKSSGGSTILTGHEQWVFYNNKLKCVSTGKGIMALKNALPMDKPGFVHFRIDAENVGNTGSGIITTANIILQWKGPKSTTMSKVKNNAALQSALNNIEPNKGFIEVLGTQNLSTANVFDRWRPGSGSKVIQDD